MSQLPTREPPVVAMYGITKRFAGGVLANAEVNLTLRKGEILALLGENGAGKSTLMNILYGLYRPDEGEVRLHGQPVDFHSAHDAIAAGLGMVHQHFMLVPTFTVAENLMIGQGSPRNPRLEDHRVVHERIRELSTQYGLEVDPAAYVWQLSVGQEQRVEILKALYRKAEILILDEPTAVLTPQEVSELLAIMRRLADDGRSIIFISHKLNEVMSIADQIAVMRDGRMIGAVAPSETNPVSLSRMMVGRDVLLTVEKSASVPGAARLNVEDLHVEDDRGLPAVRGLSLAVRSGEIVGIAGVEGNGQRELEEALGGLRPVSSGTIHLNGNDVSRTNPKGVFEAGLGHVPSDRYKTALLQDFSIADNLVLETIDRAPFAKRGLLNRRAIIDNAVNLIRRFDVRTRSAHTEVAKLSGGNAQKVVLARALSNDPAVLLVAQPTRGVDIGAIEYIHSELIARRDAGMAILLISTELDEILSLSDRIVVLYEGEAMGTLAATDANAGQLGLLMAGTRQSELDHQHE